MRRPCASEPENVSPFVDRVTNARTHRHRRCAGGCAEAVRFGVRAGDETAAGQLVATRERPERLFPAAFAPLFRGSPPFGVDGGARTDWNFACRYQACRDIAGMLIGATVRGCLMPPFSSRLWACGQRRRVDHNSTGAATKPRGDRLAHRWQVMQRSAARSTSCYGSGHATTL